MSQSQIRGILAQPKRHDWTTPKPFFDKLNAEFHFGLDAAASDENALCPNYFTEEDDALSQSWGGYGAVWLNSPYGREIGAWVKKAWCESVLHSVPVVSLVPARVETRWFDYAVSRAQEIRFVKGRLRFGDSKISAPFPSAVIVFRGFQPTSATISWIEQ